MAGPCNWELDPSVCCDDWGQIDPAQQLRAIRLATYVMWAATGRRFGECEVRVQPCQRRPPPTLYRAYPRQLSRGAGGDSWPYPFMAGGEWFNPGVGGCCKSTCETVLEGPTATNRIHSVTVAGVPVPAGSWLVMDYHRLVRTDGECWPCCVNFGNQDPPDFEVVYRRGEPVPAAVLDAAAVLACEFARACAGGKCRLPSRLRRLSRQGVEVETVEIDRMGKRILTGLDEVDMVIQSVNPAALGARSRVYSLDSPPPRKVT